LADVERMTPTRGRRSRKAGDCEPRPLLSIEKGGHSALLVGQELEAHL
jgi:hypothetical protein